MDVPGDILVLEDDADIRELILAQLRHAHVAVRAADSIAALRSAMQALAPRLIVLDLGLPDGDGLALCRELRAEGFEGGIIMVTARDAPIDRVLGLEIGADDYLTKPFEPRELLARIRNLLKRISEPGQAGARNARFARFGPWRLDLHQRRLVAQDGSLVLLSAAEYRLLCHFVNAPDRVLSRDQLRPSRTVNTAFDRSIDLQISRLRHKLGSAGDDVILTVRNEGYVMPGPVAFE